MLVSAADQVAGARHGRKRIIIAVVSSLGLIARASIKTDSAGTDANTCWKVAEPWSHALVKQAPGPAVRGSTSSGIQERLG